MARDVLAQMKERYPSFSKGQRAIANYIQNTFEKAAFLTAARLGQAVGVSESTVVRFAMELGYDGYPSMQKELQALVLNRLTSVQRMEVARDRLQDGDLVDTILEADMEKIRKTQEGLDRDDFQAAVSAVLQARQIYILGARSSAPLAAFVRYYFHYMFRNVSLVTAAATGEVCEQLAGVGPEDTILALSFPRYAVSTGRGARFGRERGAVVVGITDYRESPVGQCANFVLCAKSDMVSLVDSLVAPLSLINALIVAVAARRNRELTETLDQLERIWEQHEMYEPRDRGVENMQEQYDVIVVGGGAAGMFAAIHVGLAGKRVLLLERNDRLGKKLRITGKGRCNVTNCCTAEEVLQHVPRNGRFLYSAVTQYPPARMMEFLEAEGCPLKTERGNRVFPVSDSSASVQQALERALGRAGVTVRQSRVLEVWTDAGQVAGVRTDQEQIPAGKVILATGGCSYPATGSTGDGYRMAAQLGHTVIPPTGSLVPLEEAGTDCGQMQGLSLRNVAVRLVHEKGKCVYRDFGELLFTHFGLSGPTVLSASAHMGKPGAYQLVIDLKPALEEGKLDARILRDLELYQNRSMVNALTDLLPRSMIPVVLRRTQIPETLEANSLTRQQRHSLVRELKNFAVPIAGKRPVEEAIVTSGGVKTGEVNPKTMESKRVPGLYFAGEILDCDAYTGGFNLQIAWSTAYAAAMACRDLSGCGGHDEFAENG